jgi:hypothetical protein
MASSRDVLVLYDRAAQTTIRGQVVQTAIETVLNYLGLTVHFHDLSSGLPPAALSRSARAVISLVRGVQVPGAVGFAHWLVEREHQKQPLLLLGGLGFLQDAGTNAPTDVALVQAVLRPFGVHYDGTVVVDPKKVRTVGAHPALGFERSLQDPLPAYIGMTSTDPTNEVFFRMQRTDTGAISDQGVMGPQGAVLLDLDALIYVNPFSFRQQWRIDPFWLLSRGLGLTDEPRLDPTTINGRRVFYAHIDGDGFATRANLPGRPLSAESIRDNVLRRSPLPTTVSVIAHEMVDSPALQGVARSIFALPNVEPASHTYSHPHDWETGTLTPKGHIGEGADTRVHRQHVTLSPFHEIDDSLTVIQALLPAGKRVAVMLWSGRTNPTEPFLARTAALDLPNLNGGDTVIDTQFPSYSDQAPFGRRVGPYVQPYASVANENLFTNLWSGPYDGQRKALDTFRFTGSPRRLAPVNIYYHFYSGEHLAGVKALQALYHWAEAEPLTPVHASHFARMVSGFYAGAIAADGPGAWRISQNGACSTIRFDDDGRAPDLAASQNVAGWLREGNHLYVHLAPGPVRLVMRLGTGARPHLEMANGLLTAWSGAANSVRADFSATVPLQVIWAGLTPGQVVRISGVHGPAKAGPDGKLTLRGAAGVTHLDVAW